MKSLHTIHQFRDFIKELDRNVFASSKGYCKLEEVYINDKYLSFRFCCCEREMFGRMGYGKYVRWFLIGILTLTFATQRVHAAANVNILSHTGYLDSLGYYHVVGEVQNTGDQAVNFVKITATFYDSSDVVVSTDLAYTMLDVILPNRKSPFEVILWDAVQSSKVDHYSLTVTYSTTSPKPLGLEILSNSSYIDSIGWMHVVGEIKNIETGTANYVKVIATYYDEAGNVVAAAFTYSDPSDIEPGQKAPFEILLSDERTPYVVSYKLTAESNQYTLIPEFPSVITTLLLAMAISITAIVSRKPPKRSFLI